jgi:hypothetical protein
MAWRVDPQPPTDTGTASAFYGAGCYTLLNRPTGIYVYQRVPGRAVYLGLYGDVSLPSDFPPITFPEGSDQLVVVPVETP